jgi:hypothetical protein
MKIITNYVEGTPKTEIYKTGNDVYYDGTIYKFPDITFDGFFISGNGRRITVYWDGELVLPIFVDSLEDIGKTEWTFEEIPEEFYNACPVVEVESNEVIDDIKNSSEDVE